MKTFIILLSFLSYPLMVCGVLSLAGLLYYFRDKLHAYKIQPAYPDKKKVFSDFRTSIKTAYFFIPAGIFISLCTYHKMGMLYTDPLERGLPYFFLSLFLLTFVHDTYYYWLHRLMHTPFFYKRFHADHHQTANVTVVSFYAIHWVEAILISLSMPIAIFLFPVSILALKVLLPIHTLQSIMNHAGYEFLPNNRWTSWYNSTLTHNLHHQKSRVNYSYYFTFWDKWMGSFDKQFDEEHKKFLARRGHSQEQAGFVA